MASLQEEISALQTTLASRQEDNGALSNMLEGYVAKRNALAKEVEDQSSKLMRAKAQFAKYADYTYSRPKKAIIIFF